MSDIVKEHAERLRLDPKQFAGHGSVIYAISDEPMSAEEWKKQYVTDR